MRIARTAAALSMAVAFASGARAGEERERHDGDGRFQHIFFIMMENHATNELVGNLADAPYLNSLLPRAGFASNYFGVTHPSLPNYLATVSGDFQGIWDDCRAGQSVTCAPEEFVADSGDATSSARLTPAQVASATATPHQFQGRTILDELEAHRRSWQVYMQSLPAAGSDVEYAPQDASGHTIAKLYAQKHNPFMYFANVRNSPARRAKIVPFTAFDAALAANDVADFVWISPDQCHDMHGVSPAGAAAVGLPSCGYPASGLDHGAIALGDQFLRETIGKIERSQAWKERSAIVVVWDEDDYAGYAGCCGSPRGEGGVVLGGANAPALVLTSRNATARTVDRAANHYSMLGTIERLLGLGCLGKTCALGEQDLLTPLFRDADE